MPTVVLHNGHLNVDLNPDAGLHGEYGAAGELDWIVDFQSNYSRPELERRGYTVKLTDGSGPNQDFAGDVFIADHYDGGAPGSAYFNVAHYQPDSTAADADRLCSLLIANLAAALPYGDDQRTVTINETRYYGFTYESQADAIIEWGNGPNAGSYSWLHDPANLQACAAARADALDAYFGNQPPPPPPPPPPDRDAQLVTMLSVIGDKTYLQPVDLIGIRLLVQQAKAKLGAY